MTVKSKDETTITLTASDERDDLSKISKPAQNKIARNLLRYLILPNFSDSAGADRINENNTTYTRNLLTFAPVNQIGNTAINDHMSAPSGCVKNFQNCLNDCREEFTSKE